jgi:polyisoprenoid-binding protein YceI
MKKAFLTLSLFIAGTAATFAQTYMTRTGKVSFDASAPSSPEKVTAINNEAANIMDAKSGQIIFQVPIKSFKFEKELMQEHFNENYMESDKYPRADFKGTITNLSELNVSKDGTYNVKVAGKLTIHGVTNDVTTTGTLIVKGNTIKAKAKFPVNLHAYKIDIPALVADKVGKEATITLESDLTQK